MSDTGPVVLWFDSIIPTDAMPKISVLQPASVAKQAGSSLTWLHNTVGRFAYDMALIFSAKIEHGKENNEPSHELMIFFFLCKLVLQMHMHSHLVGLNDYVLVEPFIYFRTYNV